VNSLTSTTGVVALVAIALGAVAVIVSCVLAVRLARLRSAQRVVLGDRQGTDIVEHAAQTQRSFEALREFVEQATERLDMRLAVAEARLDGAVTHRALVRYDAYGEMSGRQSTSLALLDASRSGVVLSSIHHRDQARLYVKLVREGRGELELSPEEAEAVAAALAA
jgi:uncharacterized protein DUF4446